MKLHLNLVLRRALLATMSVVSLIAPSASAGIIDSRYDVQYYLDFSRNKGMFAAGATNISVFYKDGTSVPNPVIPLMPNLNSFAQVGRVGATGLESNGGSNLISPQFMYGASHVYKTTSGADSAYFLSENSNTSTAYAEANMVAFGDDSAIQRLTKIVTEVAYTPMADEAFMQALVSGRNKTWLYRLGNGGRWDSEGNAVSVNNNTLGGVIDFSNLYHKDNGDWVLEGRFYATGGTPLDNGVYFGDSGSPMFAWDEENERFLLVGSLFVSNVYPGFNNSFGSRLNPTTAQSKIDAFSVSASGFSGTDDILWGQQDATTGKGTLTQGASSVEYTGKGSGNSLGSTLGLSFTTQDTENTQRLVLQGSVDMGAGSLTFDSGRWELTEAQNDYTFNSAGFVVNAGAELTLNLTAASGEEWRKVGEGTMTIAGSGNNEAVLRVGGGTTQYNVSYDESGNIIGCNLGNVGETRLNRTGGYAAGSVRLEGGVAILVLMQDGQFKTNSVAGDTFTFGNAGGLLNLNGHNLEWGVINQSGSGTGARIGNFTPLGEQTPGLATFTYTGNGTFAGCFMDEGAGDDKAQLAVVYNNTAGGSWTLTGNHSNAGGFTVQSGTLILQGSNTPHVNYFVDKADWTYASMTGTDVTVRSGAAFQLSHHALMQGNVTVEDGGSFLLNQTVNAASESISGGLRQDMNGADGTGLFQSLVGNVTLKGTASMTVDVNSPVNTTMRGDIINSYDRINPVFASFTKKGSGVFVLDGRMQLPRGVVESGGLVVKNAEGFVDTYSRWTIQEEGFLAVEGLENETALRCIDTSSSGVLALTSDQETALDLSLRPNLIIGAWGDVTYGTMGATLSAVNNVWRLGGGTGTLTVNFKLTGESDLIIGNQWSNGTVHLANTGNDFSGTILIQGLGNVLTYADGALGSARVSLPYGNAMALKSASQLEMIAADSGGVLALETSENLDLSGTKFSLGAVGEQTYRGELTVDDTYRFGGTGHLTLDTDLNKASAMELDGQGMSGSSVSFARENAFTGTITAGGGLHLSTPNSAGSIDIHVGHEKSLAAAAAVELQKGAVLHTDGNNIEVRNLTLQSGSALRNNGESDSRVTLHVSENTATSFADGVLASTVGAPNIHIVKTGSGTLTMGTNATWYGGLTISEGTVRGTIAASSGTLSSGGIGAASNVIYVDENGTLSMTGVKRTGRSLGGTEIVQQVLGTGTIELSTGGAALFSTQTTSFEGTLRLLGNTRLYLGSSLNYNGKASYNSLSSLQKATVEVTEGSQVRITSGLYYQSATRQTVNTDFIISGDGYQGATGNDPTNSTILLKQENLNRGALSIDFASTVYGNITLAGNATIASWSNNPGNNQQCSASYGYIGTLGGTVRGRILGDGKTLTIGGNESMTFTADSANTYGNLVIANGNGNNTDKFALLLNGGKAVSQTSTALGTGSVSLGDNLILRMAGTDVQNNTDVMYTYANNITAGNNATLQSYNITNRLTGTVSMSGNTLNLATANGGVLELAGGISGSGTLNVGAASQVILGTASAGTSFRGNVVAGTGADISLLSAGAVSADTIFSGSDSMTLHLGGTADYELGGISATSALTLHFDFTNSPMSGKTDTWATLSSSISATTTTIALDLNLFNDLEKGNYTLISSAGSGTTYQLADNMNGRLNLVTNDSGALVLTVDADNRLFWRTGGSGSWNSTDANWYSEAAVGLTVFSSNANVMMNRSGVTAGNSSAARETISLSDSVTVGTLGVQESAYEVTGAGAISGTSLVVGNGGDMKLSNAGGSTFTEGVVVNDAALTVAGNTLTANVLAEASGSFTLQNGASLSGNLTVSDAAATISQSSLAGDISAKGSGKLVLESAAFNGAHRLNFEDAGVLSASSGVTLSGTFTFASKQTVLQAEGMSISGGSLSSAAALDVDTLAMSGASLTLTHAAGTTTQIDAVTGNGTLEKNTAGNLSLGDAALSNLTLKGGGVSNISGKVTVSGQLSLGKETVNLLDGAAVTVGRYTSGNTANSQPTQVRITSGASLTVTGNNDADATNASFLLAHWGSSASTLTLDGGTLNAQNTSMLMSWDSGATFEATAGTANLKGIRFSAQRSHGDYLILGSATSGSARINLGSAGISGIGTNDSVLFGNGTIGAVSDFSISGSGSVQLTATEGSTVFDTNGHRITVNSALTGEGNITKQGEGTLLIAASGSGYSGNIAVNAGALAVNATGKDILTSAASVTVGSGATLDLSALDFTDSSNRIAVDQGSYISFADTSTVAFGALEQGTEYGIFDISGGELEGWSSLTASNFVLNGIKLSDLGRVELALGMTGSFSYTIADGWDLVWNGGEEKQNWNQSEANQVWQTASTDPTTGAPTDIAIGYKNNDNVVFNSHADLELEGNIRVNNLTVSEGVNLKTAGSLTVTGALSVGNNVSWSFSGDTNLSFTEAQLKSVAALEVGEGATLTMTDKETAENTTSTAFDNVSGSGNVVLNLSTTDNGVGFNLSRISGDITVATGRLQVNTSTFNEASDIYLSSSNAELVFNGTGTVLKNDVILGATNTIHVNDACSGELAGSLSGQTLTKMGVGTLNISGTTNLAGLTVSGGTVNFNENASVSSLSVESGATLGIEADKTLTVTSAVAGITCNGSLSGTGTVEVAFTNSWNNKLQLGSSFDGTAYVKQGYVDLSDATPGDTLRLAAGVNANSAEKACTAAYDIVLEGESTIHANSGKNIVYQGTISGTNGVFASNGSGTHTFDGSVDLKGFQTDHSSNTTTFNNQTTLDTATISRATVNFNGETTIGTANISGGNTNFGTSAAATLSAVNQTGGTIKANGTVNINGRFNGSGGTLALQSGEVNLSYAGDAGNSAYILDGSIGDTAAGSLRLKENTKLNVGYQLWGRRQSSVVLEKDAALTHGSVQFSNRGTQDATLKTSSDDSQYSVGASDWSLTKGHLTATSGSEVTLGTQLVNSSVENAGSGKLTVDNVANSITDVYASAGDMAVMQQAAGLNLDELVVASGKIVSAYTGTEATSAAEANVTVNKRAEFGAGAVLNANLTLAAGATLEVGVGGLTMGSTLTLSQGLTLGVDTLSRVQGLSVGESTTLFRGVDGLTLGNTSYTSITTEDSMLASPWFTNLTGDQYVLTYTGTDNGTLSILSAAVPEPTSTTLSLLALSALAMRRRRK